MRKSLIVTAMAVCTAWVSAQAQTGAPYNNKYDVGMKGGGGHYSQWIKLDINVYPDGTVTAPIVMENDVFGEGFCGTVRLELHDLRDNALLFAAESPAYCIGSKGTDGHAVREGPVSWVMHMSPEIARQFMAHPSVYGVKSGYKADSSTD
jgi:hypothetical protein